MKRKKESFLTSSTGGCGGGCGGRKGRWGWGGEEESTTLNSIISYHILFLSWKHFHMNFSVCINSSKKTNSVQIQALRKTVFCLANLCKHCLLSLPVFWCLSIQLLQDLNFYGVHISWIFWKHLLHTVKYWNGLRIMGLSLLLAKSDKVLLTI